MNARSDVREPASESGEAPDRKPEKASAAGAMPRTNTTRIALGSVVVLLLLGAAAYYVVDRRPGTEVAMRPAPESPPAPTPARPPETAVSPAPSAAPTPPPAPAASQQSTSPAPQPPAAPSANAPSQEEAKPLTHSVAAAPKTGPEASAPAPAAPPSSMRDQPAALPDQAAAVPKNETVLIVMRGPANIRSAPGKGGRVVGTAAKDTTVKELSRSGKWVEVKTESGTGWIAAALLAPHSPQSR